MKKYRISNIRSILYKSGKILGDIQAIRNKRIGKRIGYRIVGKFSSKLFGKFFK
tara:strand:- start:18 stop:179 length:162 start_codon:yes stop_codon:yes gene_type:complete